jgi:hypothetical protein
MIHRSDSVPQPPPLIADEGSSYTAAGGLSGQGKGLTRFVARVERSETRGPPSNVNTAPGFAALYPGYKFILIFKNTA